MERIQASAYRQTNSEREATKGKKLRSFDLNPLIYGADARIRTVDLLITNQLLYQLSYAGLGVGILSG